MDMMEEVGREGIGQASQVRSSLCRRSKTPNKGSAHSIRLCSPTGAKRNVPSERSVSCALNAVTATMEANVHQLRVPVSVNLATRALAARSGCAPRACMAQAALCPAPVTLRTLSGMSYGQVSLGQGLSGPLMKKGLPGCGSTSRVVS